MSGKILVYIDQFKGAALPASWEVLSAAYALAEKLGSSVAALTLGADSKAVAEQTFQYGPEEVFYCDDASLADYRAEPYTAVVVKAAQAQNAIALLFPTTSANLGALSSSTTPSDCAHTHANGIGRNSAVAPRLIFRNSRRLASIVSPLRLTDITPA